MDYKEAYEILHPDTTIQKLAEIEYYGGFAGRQKKIEAVNEACIVACEAMQELQDIKSQMDNNLKIYISELKQAKHDIETFWEEPTALSKALQNAIRALVEIQNYKQLGTLEEVREAAEKQKKVKVIKAYDSDVDSHWCSCGNCTKGLCWEHGIKINYCPECGQKLDWG